MEDSQNENAALLEEMISRAKKAPEPGEIASNPVIHSGDDKIPAPMVATKLLSAGYVYIYDTVTNESSLTNRNMLPAQLGKKRPDGSIVFTTVKPKVRPKRGHLKCMLHADAPNRQQYDELGLPVCPKANLTSPFQVRRHMEKRHKMEWETIEEERKSKERTEELEFRKKMFHSNSPAAILVAQKPEEEHIGEFACDKCGKSFDSHIALTGHKRSHK